MRGKAEGAAFATVREGITPAYAGKREVLDMFVQELRDHPRLCGEKQNQCKQ